MNNEENSGQKRKRRSNEPSTSSNQNASQGESRDAATHPTRRDSSDSSDSESLGRDEPTTSQGRFHRRVHTQYFRERENRMRSDNVPYFKVPSLDIPSLKRKTRSTESFDSDQSVDESIEDENQRTRNSNDVANENQTDGGESSGVGGAVGGEPSTSGVSEINYLSSEGRALSEGQASIEGQASSSSAIHPPRTPDIRVDTESEREWQAIRKSASKITLKRKRYLMNCATQWSPRKEYRTDENGSIIISDSDEEVEFVPKSPRVEESNSGNTHSDDEKESPVNEDAALNFSSLFTYKNYIHNSGSHFSNGNTSSDSARSSAETAGIQRDGEIENGIPEHSNTDGNSVTVDDNEDEIQAQHVEYDMHGSTSDNVEQAERIEQGENTDQEGNIEQGENLEQEVEDPNTSTSPRSTTDSLHENVENMIVANVDINIDIEDFIAERQNAEA